MHAERPSTTAAMVAFMRALGEKGATSVRGFRDPVATSLLPPPFGSAARLFERAAELGPWVPKLVWLSSLGLIDMVPLRTAAIDEALRQGIGEQLVILGAGLDARAYRLPWLGGVVVFEVDHPATQAYKRERVDGRAPTAREVRFVSVDFERERLSDALERAGHRAAEPTFWIWEGVTMYLEREAVRATLRDVTARSAPGSRLAVTYLEPKPRVTPVTWLVRQMNEPFIGMISSPDIARLLEESGFHVISDECSVEWRARYGEPALIGWASSNERMALAERR